MDSSVNLDEILPAARSRQLRFDRIVVTSVFGDPLSPLTWSGAPYRLSAALRRHGVSVSGFQPQLGRVRRLALAARHIRRGYGKLAVSEQILRSAPARDHHAREIAAFIASHGLRDVLHTGTLDLPAFDLLRGVKHYLYCDHTWSLALPHRPDAHHLSREARDEYDRLERESYLGLEHIFTFGVYVRDELIRVYGIDPDRVTAVGSGMGEIEPYFGPRSYTAPHLLFIAKHLFKEKGGALLLDAFSIARKKRPDMMLTIVGDERSRKHVPQIDGIVFHGRIPWGELRDLYRGSALLTQPMLNDPWGQVYLEALVSRTPVLGLRRHGLPEIVDGGQHGFLVDEENPQALADAILDALSDPDRLAAMGRSGQRHALQTYSWDRVADQIAFL